MKQYTNESQTSKLIELGFEKPKSISSIKVTGDIITTAEDLIGEPSSVMGGKITANYSIGELLSFLPNDFRDKNKNLHTLSIYTGELGTWEINYIGFESRIRTCEEELIDATFEMCVKLKEEGVI